jgi:hypothetical protein
MSKYSIQKKGWVNGWAASRAETIANSVFTLPFTTNLKENSLNSLTVAKNPYQFLQTCFFEQ